MIAASPEHLVSIRRDLHAHPELGYQEQRTSRIVQSFLSNLGIQTVGNLARGTGVIGYLPATTNPETAKTIALRADMDALPIVEETGLEYASQNPGKMHACGHDGHTTILLGTAERLAATAERPHNVVFVFQPAEEGGAGAKAMCEDGALDGSLLGKKVDMMFGLHGNPDLLVGQVATRTGPMMASADQFEVVVKGKGGHAAFPHETIDPIVVSAHILTALQTVVSRNIGPLDSAVVTIGSLHAGSAHNVISESAHMDGTMRALTDEARAKQIERINSICENVARGLGASAEVTWYEGYPVTVNDPVATATLRKTLSGVEAVEILEAEVPPVMGAEDFSFYGHHVPACFYWLGISSPNEEPLPNLHSPRFDFNDRAIGTGIEAMVSLALTSAL